jgi:hypothetical protein
MLEQCEICGTRLIKNARYCGGCGVDLLEDEANESIKGPNKRIRSSGPDHDNQISEKNQKSH